MTTYYDFINVIPSASQSEIELALDAQYNKVRRLVTHHDTNIVNQANQALQFLEKIRATLLDDGNRSAYDAAIGIAGNLGGLADLSVHTNSSPRFGFAANVSAPQASAAMPRQLPPTHVAAQQMWTCPKCKAPNVINSQFCKSCGEPLAVSCPDCNKLVEKGAQFCTHCGVNIPKALQKKEMENQLSRLRRDLDSTERNTPISDANLPELGKAVILSGGWAVVSMIAGLIYLFTLPNNLPGFDLTKLVQMFSRNQDFIIADLNSIFLPVGALFVFSIITVVIGLIKKVSPLHCIGAGLALILFMSLPTTLESSLIMYGISGDIAILTTWIMTCLVFIFLTGRILSRTRQNFEKLKPYHTRLPSLGCFGNLFGLLLYFLPILYGFYAALMFSGLSNLISMIKINYEAYISVSNACLFFVVGLLLAGYSLLAWKTSQTLETRFKQAVFQRVQKIEQLARQIKSLEQTLAQLNLRSQ